MVVTRIDRPVMRYFAVEIRYRQPTYELRAGRTREYQWTFQVAANSEQQARTFAREEFVWMQRNSSVGWIREIVAITVRRTGFGSGPDGASADSPGDWHAVGGDCG